MENQKLEDVLNLALSLDDEELAASAELSAGYDAKEKTWELIVKYNGDIMLLADEEVKVESLLAGYAILTLPAARIAEVAKSPLLEFIEKPKRLFPQVSDSLQDAGFYPFLSQRMTGENGESIAAGEGVLLAVIDSGIDYTLPQFRMPDARSRIEAIWEKGVEHTREEIEESLRQYDERKENPTEAFVPLIRDVTGHGTTVAAIAAAAAPASRLLIAKLDTDNQGSFPMTTSLMRAFAYVVKKAAAMRLPVAINLSFGNTYGSHDGTSLLERFIDNASEYGRCTICVGAGNEGASLGHFSANARRTQVVELAVGNYERSLSVQLWKSYADRMDFKLTAPNGQSFSISADRVQTHEAAEGTRQITVLDNTRLLIYLGQPQPYQTLQELYISFEPEDLYLSAGIWKLSLIPKKIVNGEYRMYLPSAVVRSSATGFLNANPQQTITIPATASRVISVGAYNVYYHAYADFSGRGQEDLRAGAAQLQKPELAAPGVDIEVELAGERRIVSGTSYATPFVTGAAACLMSYGITAGKDPYLYGEKVKAYLIRGAKKLAGFEAWPNALLGWGALCLRDSFP